MGLQPEPMDLALPWPRFGLVGLVGHSLFYLVFSGFGNCELPKIRKGSGGFLMQTHQ